LGRIREAAFQRLKTERARAQKKNRKTPKEKPAPSNTTFGATTTLITLITGNSYFWRNGTGDADEDLRRVGFEK
jgi:hypothetical protein